MKVTKNTKEREGDQQRSCSRFTYFSTPTPMTVPSLRSELVQRTAGRRAQATGDVQVDHGGLDVGVAK